MTGQDGDFYLNSSTGNIFKKVSGNWVFICNIAHFPSGYTGDIKIGKIKLHIENGLIISYS